MRVLLFANNRVGWQITQWLRAQGEEIVGLLLHPASRRRFGDDILRAAGVDSANVFDGSQLAEASVADALRAIRPELGVSVLFGYRIPKTILGLLPGGCINLHPGFLPYNRGAYPNVWSIVERTPAGATLHFVDEGIDTGDVIAQRRVAVTAVDTGETLYQKLEDASIALFQETWPLIRRGEAPRRKQNPDEGTWHRVRDVQTIDEIDLDATYTARRLLDILRARTFGPFRGAYFRDGDRMVYVTVQLREAEGVSLAEDAGRVPAERSAVRALDRPGQDEEMA